MSDLMPLTVKVEPEHVAEMDALIGIGRPGDHNYFRSRSEFFRVASLRLISELTKDQAPSIRQRERSAAD